LILPRWSKLGRKTSGTDKQPYIERRRGHRVPAAVPVFIYGYEQDAPFYQHTETANVSDGGGLLSLSVKVARLQKLLLTNLQTDEDLVCRVVRFRENGKGKTLVGVEFLEPSLRFWSIDFVS
jgi:c-di-GMP-binding flagellar brake protein YcgR